MSEEKVIQSTTGLPLTVNSLKTSFSQLGVKPGMVLLLHSSMSALGWVCGGPVAVILALEDILGAEGTLVMPAHSGGLSEPSNWQHPPVPESWWPVIRAEMPAFDPDLTPTRLMGAIAETFRKQPGTLRSYHPGVSFTARGKHAALITQNHSLGYSLGEKSPLARIYDLDGYVLLLGVGYHNNTSLHLAQYRTELKNKKVTRGGAPVLVNGKRVWLEYEDIDDDSASDEDFEVIGSAFEKACQKAINVSKIGEAAARLMNQRMLVDFAGKWMKEHGE